MYHRIVLTAGTSALGNLSTWICEQAIFEHEGRVIRAPEGQSEAEVLRSWAARVKHAPLDDPMRVSAEISALNALERRGKLGARPHITLIHTRTLDGQAAAELIAVAAERLYGATVERRPVSLDANREAGMRADLGAFIWEVAQALRAGEPRTTCFAPLGGYKVMTSLGYLAGAFMGYPTTYVHEEQQRLHLIPTLPVHINKATLGALAPLIRRVIWAIPPLSALSVEERAQVEAHSYLFDRVDLDEEHVGLSPFGEYLRADPEYRPLIGTRISIAKSEARRSDEELGRVLEHLERLLILARNPEGNRGLLHHEASFHGVSRPDFSLYKAVAHGQGGFFRAAWRYIEDEDHLQVKQVWLSDHARYERDVLKGALDGDPKGWIDLTSRLKGA